MKTELSDGTIRIRPYRAEDVPLLFEAGRESAGGEFTRWMPWCHENYVLEESATFVRSCVAGWDVGEEFGFAVFDLEGGEFLGGAGLNQLNRNHGFANLGYWVRSSRQGRGVAPAATRLVARFGLRELGLNRMEIVIATENLRSQRAAEKAGAAREGVLRQRLRIGGRLHDAVMYSLVAEDLDA
jgi:ribosomal-protein-serine acetyltransferase